MSVYPGVYATTLVELLCYRAAQQPHHQGFAFLSDGERAEVTMSYGELDRQARMIGALLQDAGLSGKRVLLLYPPGLDYIAAFFGCLYAGAVAVPAYPPHPSRLDRTMPRLRAIAQDSQASAVLTTEAIVLMSKVLLLRYPDFRALRWLATDKLKPRLAEAWREPAIAADTLAFLQYTSGSTSTPKGVMLTHQNLLHNLSLIHSCFGHTTESRGLIWLPPYHDMGLIGGILQPLYGGFPVTLMSPVDFLQRPLRWLQAISHSRATTSGGPNFAYDLCVRKISAEQRASLDLSSWQVAFNGAEPIRAETMARFAETFAPCGFRPEAFLPCYGLAEATLIVTGNERQAAPTVRFFQSAMLAHNHALPQDTDTPATHTLIGCGATLANQTLLIVDPDTQRPCAADQVGEIWLAGPSVAQGYWNRPEETARSFQAVPQGGSHPGPFLRTGDLGFLHGGELFITGRLKDLIIIRGRNYYPQDIELTVERSHTALRPGCSAAFAVEVDATEQLVVVCEVDRQQRKPDIDQIAAAVRKAVAEEHQLHIHALLLLKTGSIPKTSSGKIQRHACRQGYLNNTLDVLGRDMAAAEPLPDASTLNRALLEAAPVEARQLLLEDYLREQLARLLRRDPARLDLRQPLIALGLDSLMAVELTHAIESDLHTSVPMERFLDDLSIAQLAPQLLAQIATEAEAQPLTLPLHDAHAPSLVSSDQQRLWLLDQLQPGNPAYNLPAVYRLSGNLDVAALQQSVQTVVARHASLRTSFTTVAGRPLQVVAPTLAIELPLIDLGEHAPSERATAAQTLIAAEVQRPFRLSSGPLLRATLLRYTDTEHVLILVAHHIICDLWSLTLLMRELIECYRATTSGTAAALPALPLQYADLVAWQEQQPQTHAAESLAYWQQQLTNAPRLVLPGDNPRSTVPRFKGGYLSFALDPQQLATLSQLGREQGATTYMALLAAFNMLLARYTGQDDIVIGSPIAGRNHAASEHVIGFFAYPQALRVDLADNPTFRELLARVRRVVLDAFAHQHVPFAKVVEQTRQARGGGQAPLFSVMFGFLDKAIGTLDLPDLRICPEAIGREATDLELFLTIFRSDERVYAVLEYNSERFSSSTIAQLAEAFTEMIAYAGQHPDAQVNAFAFPAALAPQRHPEPAPKAELPIAISATFTAEPVAEAINFWMRQIRQPARVEFAPYNQLFQQLLDPTSLLARTQQGINVLLLRFEDWQRFAEPNGSHSATLDERLAAIERNVADLIQAVQSAAARTATPQLLLVGPAAPTTLADAHIANFFSQMEQRLARALADVPNVQVISSATLTASYPIDAFYDAHSDRLGHIPYTPRFFTALGTQIARRIHALISPPRKVIVLDCDHTLWKGICAEDGPSGVEIDASHHALQEFMLAQHHAGMLLCLCSKNDEEDVRAVFTLHPEMPLHLEHIVAWRINWQSKAANIAELARKLGLGLDSFIFVDDNAVECAEVQACLPEVLTLHLPSDPAEIPSFLAHVWAFDPRPTTAEDRQRTALYRQNVVREQLRQETLSLEDFLRQLELQVEISPLLPEHYARAAQLTQRTNQFNATTRRRSAREIHQLVESAGVISLSVTARDRFGDYGMVGLIIANTETNVLSVDTFLLSCRAFGRGIEQQMIAQLATIAATQGLARIEIPYIPSAKNGMVREFLAASGSECQRQANGHEWYTFPPTSLSTHLSSG